MKKTVSVFALSLSVLIVGMAVSPLAYAGKDRGRSSIRSRSHDRDSRPHSTRERARASREVNTDALRQLGRLADRVDRYRDRDRDRDYDRDGRRDYRRYHDRDRHDHDDCRSQRDAAIAGAVVDIVGIIANSGAYYAQPPYPAPAPRGYYETQRVLVREGYYEQYQVWVADTYDPRTRTTSAGHYETRQRYVPPLYEERQVWVQY